MLVRFECPACKGSHIFDMPETTIHMTCARTAKVMELRLTAGGDVRAAVLSNGEARPADKPERADQTE